MNILVPHNWLLDHLKTKAKPKEIQHYLSLSGPSVETITQIAGDPVYDIEVSTNRVDAMSIRGLAREAAVILERYDLSSELKPLNLKEDLQPETSTLPLPKINNDPELSHRILCAVLSNVKQKQTPNWMAKRLKQAGFQIHNTLIDITNYVTHELGHPCHAFDYDKIMDLGGVINVGQAKAGKLFTTLDGVERETVGGEIVFTNEIGTIIDLPAIIGTANSSVDKNTKNILFWIEDLDARKVRQASINHAIRTVAAQLNEKQVDPHLGKTALLRGVELYQKLTKAKIASQIFDEFPKKRRLPSFEVPGKIIKDYLGVELPAAEVKQILSNLGCEITINEKQTQKKAASDDAASNEAQKKNKLNLTALTFEVQPPTFRPDLKQPVDVIEEVARIYGYQNIPSQLMTGQLPLNQSKNVTFKLESRIKHFLSHLGWQEIYSLSLVSEKLAAQSNYHLKQHLKLSNPLLTDHQYLRRSLIPSLHEAITANPQAENLSVFEIAAVYRPQEKNLPQQPIKLGLVSNKDYRKVRGDLEALLKQFYLDQIIISPLAEADRKEQQSNSDAAAQQKTEPVQKNNTQQDELLKQEGVIKVKVNDELAKNNEQAKIGRVWILDKGYTAIEISCRQLAKFAKKYPNYQPKLKTTPIIEELTFVLTPQTRVGEVINTIKQTDGLVTQVKLLDVYQQNFTFQIHYQDPVKNLASADLTSLRKKVVKQIEATFQAKLVGEV